MPTEQVYQIAESINEERAASLQYRLDNEDLLLEKAEQKPLGGWGSWGRNFVYNQEGQNISTTDGYWIIVIGVYGWIGYLAQFGLLTLPMILLGLARIRLSLGLASSCLGVVMSINLIDQIPNATVSPIVWLIAGSMMGLYQTAPLRVPPQSRLPSPRRTRIQRHRQSLHTAESSQKHPGDTFHHRTRPHASKIGINMTFMHSFCCRA